MSIEEAANLLEKMADGDGSAVIGNKKEVDALYTAANYIFRQIAVGLKIEVEDLDIFVWTYNSLKNANIQTLADLTQRTEKELRKLKFKKKSLDELKKIMAVYGLKLKAAR